MGFRDGISNLINGLKFSAYLCFGGFRRDVKRLEMAAEDIHNFHRYLLPVEKVEIIERAGKDIKEMVLEGRMDDIFSTEGGPLEEIYNVVTSGKDVYVSPLVYWSIGYQRRIVEKAKMQKDVGDFFKGEYPERIGPNQVIDLMFCGKPRDTNVDVYVKEDEDFYVRSYNWPSLKIVRRNGSPNVMVKDVKPVVVLGGKGKMDW